MTQDSSCPRCNAEVENMDHLFLTCPVSACIWANPSLTQVLDGDTSNLMDWLSLKSQL